jgi:hypothetical protein
MNRDCRPRGISFLINGKMGEITDPRALAIFYTRIFNPNWRHLKTHDRTRFTLGVRHRAMGSLP